MYKEILCNMENLREAYRLAHRSKTNSKSVIEFDENKSYNLNLLLKKLKNKEWDKIFVYYRFKIFEPKERIVDALTFEGRIVQHVLCDKILKPYFEPRLVKENCACRINKGTDFALKLTKQGLVKHLKKNNDGYVLKMDVKKYFPSIDRQVLKDKLKKFPDKEVLELIYWIIDNAPEENGLPIGNQTSQWFALYYLNDIDRIIKEKYKIKFYVRYMDDLIIVHSDKDYLIELLKELKRTAKNQLKLVFNGKTQIVPLHKGVTFLGWKFQYAEMDKIVMRIDSSKKHFRISKIKEIQKLYKTKRIDIIKYSERIMSVRVNLERGDTYLFRQKHKVFA